MHFETFNQHKLGLTNHVLSLKEYTIHQSWIFNSNESERAVAYISERQAGHCKYFIYTFAINNLIQCLFVCDKTFISMLEDNDVTAYIMFV